ncbi:MAG: DUF4129 domain-containing transglutaminase family protein, partial [Ilumatobacteraceae bacterium]
ADDATLDKQSVTALPPSAQLDGLPPSIRNLGADIVEGKAFGWAQVAAIRDTLRNDGFYDASPTAPPGHSFFRLAEFLADRKKVVGYEEQYAAAAAVLLRITQLPTRVVVGYVVPDAAWKNGGADVVAGDISAWVEVLVDGTGWVPVDVTPARTRTPAQDQQGSATQDVAVPDPPPPPPPPPDVQVVTANHDDESSDKPPVLTASGEAVAAPVWTTPRIVAASSGSLLLLLALAAAAVLLMKVLRRRRRRRAPAPAVRIAGAWNELADRCRDAGVPLPPHTTPLEAARAYLATERSAGAVRVQLDALVGTIDRAAYHAEPPHEDDAARAWDSCDGVVAALVQGRGWSNRLRMRLDPRTAFRRERLPSNR